MAAAPTPRQLAGGQFDTVGTVFLINAQNRSPGGPQQTPTGIDVFITNFHSNTDTLLVNPAIQAALIKIPTFLGTAANYGQALALLSGGGALQTQAVYQADIGAMWVDLDNNGLLNALDLEVFITFASPGFQGGSINFGDKLGLFTGVDVANYISGVLNPAANVVYSGTLLPGQFLFAQGPGNNDTLTLNNGNVANGILVGFEKLDFSFNATGTLSVNQWNGFFPQITGQGINTVLFLDGIDLVKGNTMTTVAGVESYDFSGLGYGITMTTPGFNGGLPEQGAGFVIGTGKDDTFNVHDTELKAGFTIDGKGGTDTLNLDANVTFGTFFGQIGDAGTTNAVVLNVETLNLLDAANNVGFNAGTQFTKVVGGALQDIIRDPENLAGAWSVDVMGGTGFNTNLIQIHNAATDLGVGKIAATGGNVGLDIAVGGTSNTTMTFEQYSLFEASAFTSFILRSSSSASRRRTARASATPPSPSPTR
ncbi:MAG: hypothetical protein U1E60_01785 [Reyranellaceae bacterium]